MVMLSSTFVSLHGRVMGLFKGLAANGDFWLGGDGFQGVLEDVADGLTATGSTQAGALQLTKKVNRCSTVAASTGVALPVSKAGMIVHVINDGAQALTVYPAVADSGAAIDGTTTATITNARRGTFICTAAGTWFSVGYQKAA